MTHRLLCASLTGISLFKKVTKVTTKQHCSTRTVASSSACKPSVPFLDSPSVVFSTEALNHHWGAWPVVIISAVGLALEILAIMRLAVMRDDVWYTKNPAACEYIETQPGCPVPCRKLVVINQKYEYPKGLLEAIQGDVSGPPYKKKEPEKGISPLAIAANTVASLGVLGLSFIL